MRCGDGFHANRLHVLDDSRLLHSNLDQSCSLSLRAFGESETGPSTGKPPLIYAFCVGVVFFARGWARVTATVLDLRARVETPARSSSTTCQRLSGKFLNQVPQQGLGKRPRSQGANRPRPVTSCTDAPNPPIISRTACWLTLSRAAAVAAVTIGVAKSRSASLGSRDVERRPFMCICKKS